MTSKQFEYVPLGELGTIVSGSTPATHVKEYWGGDIPWITPADLSEHSGVYFRGQLRTITPTGYESCSTTMLPPGSILFSSRAPIGHCAVTAYPLCTNQGFKSLIPSERLDAVYGFFALKHFTPKIVALGRGATFLEVNKEIFESIRIPVPPVTEQRRLASLLDRADRLRRLRRYALELSETYLQSVFLEMFGDTEHNSMGWSTSMLEDVVAEGQIVTYGIVQAGPHIPNGIPYIRSGDIQDGIVQAEGLLRTSPEIADAYRRSRVSAGDLVISIRASVGMVAEVPPQLNGANLTQGTARISPSPKARAKFLLWALRSPGTQRWIDKSTKGATFREITLDRLRQLPVIVPPIDLQVRFEKMAANFDRLRAQQREALRQAEHLFQTLLHQAFEGKL